MFSPGPVALAIGLSRSSFVFINSIGSSGGGVVGYMSKSDLKNLLYGVLTLTGVSRKGFFSPYKYAASVDAQPPSYQPWEAFFEHHVERFSEILDAIGADAPRLLAEIEAALKQHWDGSNFGPLDAAAAFTLVGRARPGRIIEVGCGASTHVMAAAVRAFDLQTRIHCIDPTPRSDISAVDMTWTRDILRIDHAAMFAELAPGDIAFFDSSHLLFQGSDVDMIYNRILPVIGRGVLVHVHDIFYPDPYPPAWAPRGYTEQLGLSGWLLGGGFEPVFPCAFMGSRRPEATAAALAGLPHRMIAGGSIWMRRV
jgi:hypothetical protein